MHPVIMIKKILPRSTSTPAASVVAGAHSSFSHLGRSAIIRRIVVMLIALPLSGLVGCSTVQEAAWSGDLGKVQALLKDNPALISSKDKKHGTPLHAAAEAGHKEVAEFLIVNKADVNAKESTLGMTPLLVAAMFGHKDVAELLLTNKAEVNARDNNGATPLHQAVIFGRKDTAELLLANKAEVAAREDTLGDTPLHWAAMYGHKDLVALLLANRADVNDKDNDGWTSLHCAVTGALLCKQHLPGFSRNSGLDSAAGNDLPSRAARQVRWENGSPKGVAELLLANKAEVNVRDSRGQSPLHHAVIIDDKDMVGLLLFNKADVNAKAIYDLTPLHLAAGHGHKAVAESLLANKAEVNAKLADGSTPLRLAVAKGHKDVAKLLRQYGGHE
jgi:ankyrin repeat protein